MELCLFRLGHVFSDLLIPTSISWTNKIYRISHFLRICMTFSGSGSDPSFFWIRIRILVFKNRSNSTRPRKIRIPVSVPVIWDTSVPGSQRITATVSSPVPRRATRRRTTRRRTTKRRTEAGSGSRSGIAHTDPDPDPAKSYGSGRNRIRNTCCDGFRSVWLEVDLNRIGRVDSNLWRVQIGLVQI